MPRKPQKTRHDKAEPFPEFHHPTPEQCRSIRDDLLAVHGFPPEFDSHRRRRQSPREHEDDCSVLDGLVSTLLSQNTSDSNSSKAFLSLKSAFPTWTEVMDAEVRRVEDAIRCGGLAATKASRIRGFLQGLMERRGELSLEYLRGLEVEEVKRELSGFKGIGPKTVACVLMFNLHQDDFPVDTHVLRIAKAIGWVPDKADREKAYIHLNRRIPDELKFDLNCLIFTHGKLCRLCSKKGSKNLQTGTSSLTCPLSSHVSNAGGKIC